jgi:carboxyl-terminal processing protease
VGTRTFGKGVFQEIEPLDNGGAIDLTIGRYYLPDGKPLPQDGVQADVRAVDDPKTKPDEALPIALRVLVRDLK